MFFGVSGVAQPFSPFKCTYLYVLDGGGDGGSVSFMLIIIKARVKKITVTSIRFAEFRIRIAGTLLELFLKTPGVTKSELGV